mmetsp:Transcript_125433/g.360420  ORF Transcript_125433/g.360420 Transcript_125433/m.360420 type:complete len:255 (+) Transcript_125433:1197-1961(+)
MNRHAKPTNMIGNTLTTCGKMSVDVLLPSMLKRRMPPKTHSSPRRCSTWCKRSRSVKYPKQLPVTMTRSSGWNHDPEQKPIGTSSCPVRPLPNAKANKVTDRTIKNASIAVPLKTDFPKIFTFVRLGRAQPLMPPSRAPHSTVATMRKMFAKTMTPIVVGSISRGDARPVTMPNAVKMKEASRGAHMNTSRGSGCSGMAIMNSFIFGITRPSPRAHTTTASTNPSCGGSPMQKWANVEMPMTSKQAGTQAITKM